MPTAPTTATAVRSRFRQLVVFGMVGGVCFIVDVVVYNLLRLTILDDRPIGAKIISVAVAAIVGWLGNRYLTFGHERGRSTAMEALLFALINVIGLAIAAGCLFVSHYVLGFTSTLADNIAGNGVGLVLGTAFRFAGYRLFVFTPPSAPRADRIGAPRTGGAVGALPDGIL